MRLSRMAKRLREVSLAKSSSDTAACRWSQSGHDIFSKPFDNSQAAIPSHEQVRWAWNAVNAELWKGFETMSWSDWLQRHSAVSEEDFAKDTSRNRFAILLSRTNHLSYHLGQAVLGLK